MKRNIITLLFIIFITITYRVEAAFGFHGKKGITGQGATVVASAIAKRVIWQPRVSIVGNTKAAQGITVSNTVSGIITAIAFKSGQMVKKGQLLITLNHQALQANVDNDRAKLTLANSDYQRYLKLYQRGIISGSDANLERNRSQVAQIKSQLAKDQALLNEKIIRAPFSGRVGISHVDVGQYIAPGSAIVSLQQIDPLYVDFTISENRLVGIKAGNTVRVKAVLYPKKVFSGKILALGAALDSQTRSLPIRAKIANPQGKLLPGMYVDATVLLPLKQHVIVVPQTAVIYHAYGNAVYIIKNHKVLLRYVRVGKREGNHIIITSGLSPGDEVVIAGQNKLHQGMIVTIDNRVKPKI